MALRYFGEQVRNDMNKELSDCIVNKYNPCCHVANWNHFNDRVTGYYKQLNCEIDTHIHEEIFRLIDDMKPIVEQWLEYYKQHNESGIYDAWIEMFWNAESLNKDEEEICYMTREYEKLVNQGVIEIFYYSYSSNEERKAFLSKWCQQYSFPYSEDNDLGLYIGQKGKIGKFYEYLGDFYEPVDSPKESDWWQLVSGVLQDINSQLV